MPGKRIIDTALTRTTFPEVVANNGEILTDWETGNPSNQLVWARPIPLKLIGNAWWQGSYDSATWDNYIKDDHVWARVSTDGGVTWLVFKMSDCNGSCDDHPPVTIGSPDGGLVISGNDTQILTLNNVTTTNSGAMSPPEHIKLAALKFDYLNNIGGGYEVFKDYVDSPDDIRTHNLRTLVAGANTTLSYVGDTIVINSNTSSTTGQANTGHNDGTLGYGVFDRMNGDILEFRHVHSLDDIINISLDDVNNNIEFQIIESNIDHDILENFVPDEHIDHSTVSILTTEGITGGGDITTTRTLSLAFDELASISYDKNDFIAVYDADTDTHYTITLASLPTGDTYEPVNINAGLGLSGGGLLDQDRTLRLSINSLPTVAFESTDYVAVYDTSASTHAKVTLADIIGELAVSITAGDGMDFTTITSTGAIDMGTPASLTKTTINSASGTTHEHVVDLSTWDLIDIGDVDGTPTDGYYLKWDSATSTWITDNPAVGATTPGLPLNSIQFNSSNVFTGNAGLLYQPLEDRIYLSAAQTSTDSGLILSDNYFGPQITASATGTKFIFANDIANNQLRLNVNKIGTGTSTFDSDTFFTISDKNISTPFDYTLKIKDNLDELILGIENDGEFYLPKISSDTTDNVLYFDPTTGLVTYGAGGGSGSSQTLLADALSGLMVNGGNTSSAAIIELDQNDSKLTSATPTISDYIGFWDESASLQSKTLIGNLPGWDLYVNSALKESIQAGDKIDFVAGTDIGLIYNLSTNALTIENTKQIDLYTNGALREADISILDISSSNIGIHYTSPGKVTLSYVSKPPPYTHLPDAFIAFDKYLYAYDISEGTAEVLINAPVAPWLPNLSFGEDQYIWTASGTTVYRYDIVNDVTDSVQALPNEIKYIFNGSDGVYVIGNHASAHIDKSTLVSTDYGDTLVGDIPDSGVWFSGGGTDYHITNLVEVEDALYLTKYLLFYNDTNDRFYYKEIKSTYSGSDNDDWVAGFKNFQNTVGSFTGLLAVGSTFILFSSDNESYIWNNFGQHIGETGKVLRDSMRYTYNVPSGHIFSQYETDEVSTVEITKPIVEVNNPTSYSIVRNNKGWNYDDKAGSDNYKADPGLYVAEDNAPFNAERPYEQVINASLNDLHVEVDGTTGVYVMVGGDDGMVYFHNSNEDPKQFMSRKVSVVSSNKLHSEETDSAITFVYFSSTYTSGGVDPKDSDIFTGIDLHVNNTLVQEQIPKIDIIAGTGVSVAYSGDSGVTISTTEAVTTIEDVAFVFSDVTGESQTYTLDLLSSFDYEIVSIVIKADASVGFDLNVNSVSVLSNTATTSTVVHAVGENIAENDVVELVLGTSSATEIKGKLRIQRL